MPPRCRGFGMWSRRDERWVSWDVGSNVTAGRAWERNNRNDDDVVAHTHGAGCTTTSAKGGHSYSGTTNTAGGHNHDLVI